MDFLTLTQNTETFIKTFPHLKEESRKALIDLLTKLSATVPLPDDGFEINIDVKVKCALLKDSDAYDPVERCSNTCCKKHCTASTNPTSDKDKTQPNHDDNNDGISFEDAVALLLFSPLLNKNKTFLAE